MELKKTELKFKMCGELAGLTRTGHGYGSREGKTKTGSEYKGVKFDVIIDKNHRFKVPVEIFGITRDTVTYKDNTTNKVETAPWDKRFELRENEDYYVFPQPYDAAVQIADAASDGENYFIKGDVVAGQYQKENKTYHTIKFSAVDAEPTASIDFGCIIEGKFIFNKVKKNKIYGFVVNYKKEVQQISFVWGGDADVLKDIEECVLFGTECGVTNAKVEMGSYDKKSDDDGKAKKSFGESNIVDPTKARPCFVLYGLEITNEERYTSKDLGLDDDDIEEELFS